MAIIELFVANRGMWNALSKPKLGAALYDP